MSAVSVIIPALNEEEPIANVVRECLATKIPSEIIVVDNGSSDRTAVRARQAGAKIVAEPRHGYGRACLAGIRAVSPACDIVVFLDGDGSDCPEFMNQLVEPIAAGNFDFVIGSRTRGQREPGSMNFQQIFAGRLAGGLMSARRAESIIDERRNLRLESGNADESRPRRSPNSRSAGQSPSTRRRRLQSFRHIERNVGRWGANYGDICANRACAMKWWIDRSPGDAKFGRLRLRRVNIEQETARFTFAIHTSA